MQNNGFNPKDPLLGAAPPPARVLFDRYTQATVAGAFHADHVIDASVNMMVNALRQSHPTRQTVEARYDEIVGKAKTLLLSHYDSVTGKRRSIFPFTQHVNAALVKGDDKIKT